MFYRDSARAGSSRRPGWEFRAVGWLAHHPLILVVPLGLGWSLRHYPFAVAGSAGVLLAIALVWWRAHPDTFDTTAAPVLRSWWRRWFTRYAGRGWRDVTLSCDLAPAHRRTGAIRYPRVLRVRSLTPSIDVVRVRMVPGQATKQWQDKAAELADALSVERVAIERARPQVLGVIVQRRETLTEIIDAPDMPAHADAVDLRRVYLGETEYGTDWHESILGQHVFIAGATGAGKNSIPWSALRSVAPLIADGTVRVWMLDPKRVELVNASTIAYRYAAEPDDCLAVVGEFVEDMRATQRRMSAEKRRKVTPCPAWPLNLLVMDELAMLTAYGPAARDYRRLLTEIGTQGRASGHLMWGMVQEPSKDTVSVRDYFTLRICLRVTSAAHVDMTLGENARLRGALADEIPNDPTTAGIGYAVRQRSRVPYRVRAGWVSDSDLAALVTAVTSAAGRPLTVPALEAVPADDESDWDLDLEV